MWMKERVGGTGVTGDPLSSSHPSYLSPWALNLLYSLIPPPQNSCLLFSRPDQPSTHTLLGPVMTCAINPPILSHPLSVTHTHSFIGFHNSVSLPLCPWRLWVLQGGVAWEQSNTLTQTLEKRVQCLAKEIWNITFQTWYSRSVKAY